MERGLGRCRRARGAVAAEQIGNNHSGQQGGAGQSEGEDDDAAGDRAAGARMRHPAEYNWIGRSRVTGKKRIGLAGPGRSGREPSRALSPILLLKPWGDGIYKMR
jgi:hypothetical protein